MKLPGLNRARSTEHNILGEVLGGGAHTDGPGVTLGKHYGQILSDVSKCFKEWKGALDKMCLVRIVATSDLRVK